MITAVLIFLPLVAGLLLFLAGNEKVKQIALAAAIIEFLISVYAFATFKTGDFNFSTSWIPSLGISFNVGMDGISILLVMLTTFLVPLIILSSFRHSYSNSNLFYALVMIMQSALVGVFVAKDAFLFYIFWELALIPIYFISLLWGGDDRRRITFKFFIYTLAGSLFMLLGIIYLYLKVDSFEISAFYGAAAELSKAEQGWLFWAFFLAFAIKMPVFPFHTWQPDTYTSSPAQGTMLLSGIMLKMGIYGLIRFILPIVPIAVIQWGQLAVVLSVAGIVYASVIAIKQKDLKRLIAYASIAHVGLIAAGVLTQYAEGLQGAMIQMLSHGIVAVGLFYIVDIISERTNTREIAALGGLRNTAPLLAVFFLIILMASIALPLTSGFVGEFMLFVGLFSFNPWLAGTAGVTIILGAVYMLSSYQKVMLGELKDSTKGTSDLIGLEKMVLIPIIIVIFWIGLYPKPLLDISEPAIAEIIKNAGSSLSLK